MAIQRWDPLRDLVQLKQTINRMFEDALARSSAGAEPAAAAAWTPPIDLHEETDRYVLRADLPGVAAGEVDVKVEQGRLSLRGARRTAEPVAREAYLRVERPSGPFLLQLALPGSVDPAQIRASQRNGVLEVVLPKRSESTPSRIAVRSED
jgi:HSP20 family protein